MIEHPSRQGEVAVEKSSQPRKRKTSVAGERISPSSNFPSPEVIEAYVIYRQRIREWIHLALLFSDLNKNGRCPENVLGETDREFASTLRTALLGWLASLVDKDRRALNVFSVWLTLFPEKKDQIQQVEARIAPYFKKLRDFRNNAAFHASNRIAEHRRVRQAVLGKDMTTATDKFLHLCIVLLKEEKTVPRLRAELKKYGFA
jgi:hypothetical protein